MSRHSLQHPQHQNSGATLTAVLVTANREYRRRLANLLANRPGFTRVIEVEGLADACQQASADLIVIDLSVPDAGNGVCWGGLKFCSPNARLAAIFDGQFSQSTRLAFAAGVTGFLSLDETDENLVTRFEDVMRGIHVVPSTDFFEQLQAIEAEAKEQSTDAKPPCLALEQVTKRERDVLKLLAQGASNKEIAARLNLKEKTVNNRVSEILSKIGANNRTQAAIWAREHGLAES
jgi:DNA-binding NarL/FixJ family response regulator